MLKRVLILGLAALIAVAIACGDDDEDVPADGRTHTEASGEETVDITAKDFSFSPDEISTAPGATIHITLTNNGDAEHSFVIDELDVDIEAEAGENVSSSFTAADESVEFYCKYHPDQMRGTVNVDGEVANPEATIGAGGYYGGY